MNPEDRNNGTLMDVQPPVASPTPAQIASPINDPMAPADNIVQHSATVQQPAPDAPKPAKKKMSAGLVALIITFVVTLIIGGAVVWFIMMKNDSVPATTPADTTSENERVTTQQIDDTTKSIDNTLNTLNDSQDMTPSDVTDQTLGL